MLENASYCPILITRVAEMKALLQLPAASKDHLFPILSARPWQNAKLLSTTWDKISEALGPRRFGLDLDRTRCHFPSTKPAQQDFDELFDPAGGYQNYYEQVANIPNAIPILRSTGGIFDQLDEQINHIVQLDRGLIVRIEHDFTHGPLGAIPPILGKYAEAVIFVDAGWSPDLLGRELWASAAIQVITALAPEAEIVVSGSSFPDEFKNIVLRGSSPVKERFLHSELTRKHNEALLVYGDWGSTRPPTPMTNVPRIDLPTSGEWISFRMDKDKGEDYEDIARRAVSDPVWPTGLNIWGTYTIESTAQNLPGAIKSPATAAAARINIHLHRQAHYGTPGVVNDRDEPYTDD
jgi:hypothetical protein